MFTQLSITMNRFCVYFTMHHQLETLIAHFQQIYFNQEMR